MRTRAANFGTRGLAANKPDSSRTQSVSRTDRIELSTGVYAALSNQSRFKLRDRFKCEACVTVAFACGATIMNKLVSPKGIVSRELSKLFGDVPKPDRAEWEKTLKALKPWLSPEKFAETETIHWRMFERANRWHENFSLSSEDRPSSDD